MPSAVRQRSVIYFKAPLKIDGKLVVEPDGSFAVRGATSV